MGVCRTNLRMCSSWICQRLSQKYVQNKNSPESTYYARTNGLSYIYHELSLVPSPTPSFSSLAVRKRRKLGVGPYVDRFGCGLQLRGTADNCTVARCTSLTTITTELTSGTVDNHSHSLPTLHPQFTILQSCTTTTTELRLLKIA